MDEVALRAELLRDNPALSLLRVSMYASALLLYREAADNIAKNGAICAHPRTGAPMENPYLRVQAHAVGILGKFPTVKSDRVLLLLQKELASRAT